jgi:uncharacterized protein YcbX
VQSQIYIYPIKSLRGIAVEEATIMECGLQYDRQYVLVKFAEDKPNEPEVMTIKTNSEVCACPDDLTFGDESCAKLRCD